MSIPTPTKTCCATCWPTARQIRPHRHRHPQRVRPPDALRPGRELPADHHQTRALQVRGPGAALVPARRHQRALAAGAAASRSGTNGPTPTANSGPVYGVQWRSWPTPDGGHIDQIAEVVEYLQDQPGLPPAHRLGLERGRAQEHGAAAVPRVLPVLRGRRQALLPAVPALARTCSWACRSTSPPTRC